MLGGMSEAKEQPKKHGPIFNRFAAESVERLAALSDGIFGVAMTLLLLDLHVPDKAKILGEADLRHAMMELGPDVLVYLMSFMTLGIFWVGQQTQLNNLTRSDRHLTWLHLAFLFPITFVPFSTRLLTEFIQYRTALLVYWLNILVLGVALYCCWSRATKAGVVREDVTDHLHRAMRRRIIGAQTLYAIGAALCMIDTRVSIVFIILVQLNFAIAPRVWWLAKI